MKNNIQSKCLTKLPTLMSVIKLKVDISRLNYLYIYICTRKENIFNLKKDYNQCSCARPAIETKNVLLRDFSSSSLSTEVMTLYIFSSFFSNYFISEPTEIFLQKNLNIYISSIKFEHSPLVNTAVTIHKSNLFSYIL